MIGYVMVGSSDLDRSAVFYDAILQPLGLSQVSRTESYIAYAPKADLEAIEFYVTLPYDGGRCTYGNGSMIAFAAEASQALNQFHAIGLKSGGTDEGAPGPREEGSDICYAYLRDPDGNKICAFLPTPPYRSTDE